jgi:hypothetical protein
MDLKTKAVAAALRVDEGLYLNTRNPRHVWQAWQLARRAKAPIPGWVLQFIDQLAKSESSVRARNCSIRSQNTGDGLRLPLSHW